MTRLCRPRKKYNGKQLDSFKEHIVMICVFTITPGAPGGGWIKARAAV
jgi:hypothetical protein